MWLYLPLFPLDQDAFVNASLFNFRKTRDYLDFFLNYTTNIDQICHISGYSFISLSIQQCLLSCYYVLTIARYKTISKRWYLSSAKSCRKKQSRWTLSVVLSSRLSLRPSKHNSDWRVNSFLSSAIRQVKILANELWEEACWGAPTMVFRRNFWKLLPSSDVTVHGSCVRNCCMQFSMRMRVKPIHREAQSWGSQQHGASR